ncbi:uncharacterized protein LOC126267805 [Schistocerca gregaria]|uniref:uncharacterized protein LOC126267805 n=1 Tax=Schistocerca gregaria TaxID=7010 RepID=UPI00211F35D3|nr:uncharacterized protein LOC126267805 [Schistocerca gregaria]
MTQAALFDVAVGSSAQYPPAQRLAGPRWPPCREDGRRLEAGLSARWPPRASPPLRSPSYCLAGYHAHTFQPEGVATSLTHRNSYPGPQSQRCCGHADDVLLFALSKKGLQFLTDEAVAALARLWLHITPPKCFTLALVASGDDKKVKVDGNITFKAGYTTVPTLRVGETFRYLGLQFSTSGRCLFDPRHLGERLDVIPRAPPKPQHRLYAFVYVLLSGLYYGKAGHALSRTRFDALKSADIAIRASRATSMLLGPREDPAFHRAAGWGQPSGVEEDGVSHRRYGPGEGAARDRGHGVATYVDHLLKTSMQVGECGRRSCTFLATGRLSARLPPSGGRTSRSPTPVGYFLGETSTSSAPASTLSPPRRGAVASGRQTPDAARAAEPSKPPTTSSRLDTRRTGPEWSDMMQSSKPHLRTPEGLPKPDVVAVKDGIARVIDAQVVGDHLRLNWYYTQKATYYDMPSIRRAFSVMHRVVQEETVFTATVNWWETWSPAAGRNLIDLEFRSWGTGGVKCPSAAELLSHLGRCLESASG